MQEELERCKELAVTYEQTIARKDHIIASLTRGLQKQVRTSFPGSRSQGLVPRVSFPGFHSHALINFSLHVCSYMRLYMYMYLGMRFVLRDV